MNKYYLVHRPMLLDSSEVKRKNLKVPVGLAVSNLGVCFGSGVQRWTAQHEPALHPSQVGHSRCVSAGNGAGCTLHHRTDHRPLAWSVAPSHRKDVELLANAAS